ncbi:MAG: hypothetical protein JNJ77_10895 [Planctomycetia bacterium]|nr:hypothetical protein [Planctomycetia bacterium]
MAINDSTEKNLIRLNDQQSGNKDLAATAGSGAVIQLGANLQLDLTGLTVEQQQQLKIKHAEAMIGVNKKAQELVTDAGALNHALGTMAHHTGEVASSGQDVTITHTQDSSLGRTEIIMGTSDAAKKGKLTLSQTKQRGSGCSLMIAAIIAGGLGAFMCIAVFSSW